jgi:RNA chaperone Hfq
MELGASHSSDRSPHVKISSAEMIKFRDERKVLRFTLTNGQELEGAVRWFDEDAVHIVTGERDEMTVYKHAILYFSAR